MSREILIKEETVRVLSIAAIVLDFVFVATGRMSPVAGLTMLVPVTAAMLVIDANDRSKNTHAK